MKKQSDQDIYWVYCNQMDQMDNVVKNTSIHEGACPKKLQEYLIYQRDYRYAMKTVRSSGISIGRSSKAWYKIFTHSSLSLQIRSGDQRKKLMSSWYKCFGKKLSPNSRYQFLSQSRAWCHKKRATMTTLSPV